MFKRVSLSQQESALIYTVETSQMRLDLFLKQMHPRYSREHCKSIIRKNTLSLKRKSIHYLAQPLFLKPSSQVYRGDEIQILIPNKTEPPVSWDYQILFEDEAICVVNKPPQLPVHPAGSYFFHTLLTHMNQNNLHYLPAHRIDKDTSGVLILAKTRSACAHLAHQFATRTPTKTYLAIVKGHCPPHWTNSQPLQHAKNSKIHLKMEVAPHEGLHALTEFYHEGSYFWEEQPYSLVRCLPKTGRQHQIRVHLASDGYPIAGDRLYGLPEEEALEFLAHPPRALFHGFKRHALHASWIRFIHPLSLQYCEFKAETPEDFKNFFTLAKMISK